MADQSAEPGRFAFDGLDRVLHERARLGILTALAAHRDGLAFNDLKQLCSLTDGNLNRHLDVLQEAGLLEIRKERDGRRPRTTCLLTALGRQRFHEYLTQLESILRDAAAAEAAGAVRTAAEPPSGWASA
jgi:DNA-binding transcriptional ArsR family regulator